MTENVSDVAASALQQTISSKAKRPRPRRKPPARRGPPKDERLKALDAFKRGDVDVLAATDVAVRGLDIAGATRAEFSALVCALY